MNQDLLKAVTGRIKSGFDKESIRQELLSAGYAEADIDSIYQAANEQVQMETVAPSATSTDAIVLPSYNSLVKDSFIFVLSRKDILLSTLIVGSVLGSMYNLVLWIPIILILLIIGSMLGAGEDIFLLVMLFFGFLSPVVFFAVSLYHLATIFYVTANTTKDKSVSYSQGLSWVRTKMWSIAWIGILVALIQISGYILFIIPGIIMLVYLSMSYFVLALTDTRGLSALLLSRQVVHGHWWDVVLRQFAIVGTAIVVMIPLFLILLLIINLPALILGYNYLSGQPYMFLKSILTNVSVLFVGTVAIRGLSLIYRALEPKIAHPEQVLATAPRLKYKILAWFCIVVSFLAFTVVLIAG